MIVLASRGLTLLVALLPFAVWFELLRQAAGNKDQLPMRRALEVAAWDVKPAARWTLATMLCALAAIAGQWMCVGAIVEIIESNGHPRGNPLALIIPGMFLLAVFFLLGCVCGLRAVQALSPGDCRPR